MSRGRQFGGKGDGPEAIIPRKKLKLVTKFGHEKRGELRFLLGGAEFVCLIVSFVSLRNALVGSSSPISRSSSSRITYRFPPFCSFFASSLCSSSFG